MGDSKDGLCPGLMSLEPTPCHYQRVEKSAVGVLMTGQIEKILWHVVWDKGNRF